MVKWVWKNWDYWYIWKKYIRRKKFKIIKCDIYIKIGVLSDGKYDCYLSINSGVESNFLDELKRIEI